MILLCSVNRALRFFELVIIATDPLTSRVTYGVLLNFNFCLKLFAEGIFYQECSIGCLIFLFPDLLFNPFSTNVPPLYPLKTSENLRFFDVLRGYRSGTLVENGLI